MLVVEVVEEGLAVVGEPTRARRLQSTCYISPVLNKDNSFSALREDIKVHLHPCLSRETLHSRGDDSVTDEVVPK